MVERPTCDGSDVPRKPMTEMRRCTEECGRCIEREMAWVFKEKGKAGGGIVIKKLRGLLNNGMGYRRSGKSA